jgi:hypothetical protein
LGKEVNNMSITGVELVVKSAAAASLGLVPFVTSKAGEGIVKGCAWATQAARRTLSRFGPLGDVAETGLRIAAGIVAFIGGLLLFGGAILFSKSQQLIWGKQLVAHPQEERINTQLARYGAGPKPLKDFSHLIETFFRFSDSQKTDLHLSEIRHFKAT